VERVRPARRAAERGDRLVQGSAQVVHGSSFGSSAPSRREAGHALGVLPMVLAASNVFSVKGTPAETRPEAAEAAPPPSPTEVAPWLLPVGIPLERLVLPRLYGFRVAGRERLPAEGGVLLVLNH